MALSTAEVDYIATCLACSEAVWLRKLLAGQFDLELDATYIFCDNHSCIKLSENPVFHVKSSTSRSSIILSEIWLKGEY